MFFQNHALAHGYTTSTKNVLADESKSELVEIDRTVCHDTAASKYTYFVMKGIVDIYRFVRLNACPTFANLLNEKLPNVAPYRFRNAQISGGMNDGRRKQLARFLVELGALAIVNELAPQLDQFLLQHFRI